MGFSFEQLEVWKASMTFAGEVVDVCDRLNSDRKHYRLVEQLESAALSVAQNIAEGKGRYAKKEFIHFLFIARGSLFEVVTILTLFRDRDWLDEEYFENLKSAAFRIAGQLNALIESIRQTLNQAVPPKAAQPTLSLEP